MSLSYDRYLKAWAGLRLGVQDIRASGFRVWETSMAAQNTQESLVSIGSITVFMIGST